MHLRSICAYLYQYNISLCSREVGRYQWIFLLRFLCFIYEFFWSIPNEYPNGSLSGFLRWNTTISLQSLNNSISLWGSYLFNLSVKNPSKINVKCYPKFCTIFKSSQTSFLVYHHNYLYLLSLISSLLFCYCIFYFSQGPGFRLHIQL